MQFSGVRLAAALFAGVVACGADRAPTRLGVSRTPSDTGGAIVDASGKVTPGKPRTTVNARASADTSVSGSATSELTGARGLNERALQIVDINQRNAVGESVPANILDIKGQIDVVVRAAEAPPRLEAMGVTIIAGTDSIAQTQAFPANAPGGAADTSATTLTFTVNTADANPVTGAPALHNGTATIKAVATVAAQVWTSSSTVTINNPRQP